MAYEVFDDAAFLFFLLTILAMILLPWTISKLCDVFGICQDDESEVKKINNVMGYNASGKDKSEEEKPGTFRCSNIIFMTLWLCMLAIIFSIPSGDNLATYNPFETLEIDKDASDREIKKAYLKLSKLYHPDKNQGNQTAADMFLMISKAYQTLTDEQTKENWQKYGNPDGYQGTSVIIGLPKFLTDKNNEFSVLGVYFIIIIVLPPIFVFIWWRNAKEKGPEGIMHKTIQVYFFFIKKEWSVNSVTKFTALYAASHEFNDVLGKIEPPRNMEEWRNLKGSIEAFFGVTKSKKSALKKSVTDAGKNNPYLNQNRVQAGSLLLQAHLRRIPIPKVFKPALNYMLKSAPKLIPAMVNTTWRYPGKPHDFNPCASVIKFNQMLVQAMWAHDPIFMQLPHNSSEDIRKGTKGKCRSWDKFLLLTEEKKKKVFKDYTDRQVDDILEAGSQIPLVDMKWSYCVDGVEDEKQKEIFCDDLVTIDVKLFRKGFEPKKEDENDEGNEKEEGLKDDETMDEDESDAEEERIANLDFVETAQEKKKKEVKREVLCPYYPFFKHEVWYILLVHVKTTSNKEVADVQKIDLDTYAETKLRFRAPEKKGKGKYELHAICDSYIGCDIYDEFKVEVRVDKNKKTEDDFKEEKIMREKEEEEEVKRMEEENPPLWYYCYFSSFSEMVINAIILALLCVFIFNFLHSRGYWQQYIQPVVDISYNATCKYVYDLDPIFNPPEKLEDEFEDFIGGDDYTAES
mmetsp:Transcript_4265/g.6365  ORF Transcript_4265/g.6365 Transcript_4265/m.6365 type:complete len:743 (-) Transcript_4265:67-2295(-)|eukprot:CAMPEP_0167761644 /NCGR_PEP_ID=MMETSP0110_2-20121227/12293_1 /TAXON_ID=629695 /ORGANISM="Gymnochlora sp., Strain CCMP2014" /LENGTH=742 /DNA_ID=CAMNT_0007648363 /DNA_START=42 /DNA_END=2270 /DNA_ORIENTATION=+